MQSLLEHKVDSLIEATNNIYSIILSNRQLTKKQQKVLLNFSTIYLEDQDRNKESKKLSNTNVKCNLSNAEIERFQSTIKAKTKKIKNMWWSFAGTIIVLLSIMTGIWFTQTQYKKAGYKSLGKVIIERK